MSTSLSASDAPATGLGESGPGRGFRGPCKDGMLYPNENPPRIVDDIDLVGVSGRGVGGDVIALVRGGVDGLIFGGSRNCANVIWRPAMMSLRTFVSWK